MREGMNMAHIYENEPDARVSAAPMSRFRPTYRALTDAEKELHDDIKRRATDLEVLFNGVKDGRYKSLAMTSLEQSVMWIIKELTG
jgi:hypothetical protein